MYLEHSYISWSCGVEELKEINYQIDLSSFLM